MQWMVSSVLCVSLCPVCAPRRFAGSAFLPVEPVWWFPPRNPPDPVFACVGRQALSHRGFGPCGYPHQVLPANGSRCPGCGRCCMQTASRSHWWELSIRWSPKRESYSGSTTCPPAWGTTPPWHPVHPLMLYRCCSVPAEHTRTKMVIYVFLF